MHRTSEREIANLQTKLQLQLAINEQLEADVEASRVREHAQVAELAILRPNDALLTIHLEQLRQELQQMTGILGALTEGMAESHTELGRSVIDMATLATPVNPLMLTCITFGQFEGPDGLPTGRISYGCLHIVGRATWDTIKAEAHRRRQRPVCWCRHEVTAALPLPGWGMDQGNLPGADALAHALQLLENAEPVAPEEIEAAPEAPVAAPEQIEAPVAAPVAAAPEAADDFMIVGPDFIDLVSDDDDVMGILGGYVTP